MTALLTNLESIVATIGPNELDLEQFTAALEGSGRLSAMLTNPLVWGIAAALAGSILLATVFAARRHRDIKRHGPAWRYLARNLHLTSDQRHLLSHLSRTAGHVNPAPLVISRGCFDRAVQRQNSREQHSEIDGLRRQLFD